jgi:hypothetical protein
LLFSRGVGWRGGAGIFRFPPKLTVSHFKWKLKAWIACYIRAKNPSDEGFIKSVFMKF